MPRSLAKAATLAKRAPSPRLSAPPSLSLMIDAARGASSGMITAVIPHYEALWSQLGEVRAAQGANLQPLPHAWPASGRPIAVPSQDMIIGVYYLTEQVDGSGTGRVFSSLNEAVAAYEERYSAAGETVSLHTKIKYRFDGVDENGRPVLNPIAAIARRISRFFPSRSPTVSHAFAP